MTGRSGWERLPDEIIDLVLKHRAALAVQRAYRRYDRFGHTKRRGWGEVRRHLTETDRVAYEALALAAGVRREWRCEAASWFAADSSILHLLVAEVREGLWGRVSRRGRF